MALLNRALEWLTTGRKLDVFGALTLLAYGLFLIVLAGMRSEEISSLTELTFLADSTAMGGGIAFDVACATLVVVLASGGGLQSAMKWVFRVTFSHAFLTAVGVEITHRVGGAGSGWVATLIYWVIALGGFILIEVLLRSVDLEGMGLGDDEDDDDDDPWKWALVMAVSWDAPTTSVAKQWIVDDFNTLQLYVSYLLMGVVVGVVAFACTALALFIRNTLTRITSRSIAGLAGLLIFFMIGEFVVLRFFGLMSLFAGVGVEATTPQLLLISTMIALVMLFTPDAWKRTWAAHKATAAAAIRKKN